MRRISLFFALLVAVANAQAVDYFNARIAGVRLSAADGNLRFTIDKDPNAIFVPNQFSGEQLKRVVALVLSAYHAQSTVAFIRGADAVSSGVRHYTGVSDISIGAYTWD